MILVSFWTFVFYIAGLYSNTAQKSGTVVIGPLFFSSFIGSILVFYFLFSFEDLNLQDIYFKLSIRYLFITFGLVLIFKMIIINIFQKLLENGRIGYHLLLVGSDKNAVRIINDYKTSQKYGDRFIGFISTENKNIAEIDEFTPHLGSINDLQQIISDLSFDEAIISMHDYNHQQINSTIHQLRTTNCLIKLSINPASLIDGTLKNQKIEETSYVIINKNNMPVWQQLTKYITDKLIALAALVLSLPIFIIIAIGIKISSKGPVFYNQTRIGKNKKPFKIHKFRTMRIDAEKDGPTLSSSNDPRITPIGKYLRKWHLDEIPQLLNILIGHMSLVGPRPERKFFINQILPKAPQYAQVFTVKPGLTSWGMVKYGYAESVEQMIERMKFDLHYLENRTLATDFKILLYTIKSIIKGDGK